MGLKTVQALLARKGYSFSVGDVRVDSLIPDVMKEDGPQPKVVAARVVAHLGHRIPGIRRFEKRAEGKDKTSGIISDTFALLGQLYYRNKDTVDDLFAEVLAKKLTPKPGRKGTPAPGSHVDFGDVGVPTDSGGIENA